MSAASIAALAATLADEDQRRRDEEDEEALTQTDADGNIVWKGYPPKEDEDG